MDEDKLEQIEARKDWLANRRAWLDQKKRMFEGQYHETHPRANENRLNDIEAWAFRIAIDEWELEEAIRAWEEEEATEPWEGEDEL